VFTFRRATNELMIAAWIPGRTGDGIVEEKTDVILPGVAADDAWVIDILNGTEQKLMASRSSEGLVFKNMLIKDYPTLIGIGRAVH